MSALRPSVHDLSPDELARRAAKHDQAAFARLVRLCNADVTRVALLVTGDRGAAVRATDAAWRSAWTGLRRKHVPRDVLAWLCRLAAAEGVRLAHAGPAASGKAASTPPVTAPDLGTPAAEALAGIDPPDRALLALHHVAGLTLADLAQVTRRPEPWVEARLAALAATLDAGVAPDGVRADGVPADGGSADGVPGERRPIGDRLRALADVPVWPVDSDALARRAIDQEDEGRAQAISVVIGSAAGLAVMLLPYLARLLGR